MIQLSLEFSPAFLTVLSDGNIDSVTDAIILEPSRGNLDFFVESMVVDVENKFASFTSNQSTMSTIAVSLAFAIASSEGLSELSMSLTDEDSHCMRVSKKKSAY